MAQLFIIYFYIGAPPELLWIRLQQRLEALVLTDMYKQCLWQHFVLLSRSERGSKVTFFTTPNPLAINNVFQVSDKQSWSLLSKNKNSKNSKFYTKFRFILLINILNLIGILIEGL